MNTPFFSIIVVCRNAGERLDATVSSILEQTWTDFEIIVKDALSDDGSVERLPNDPRIRLIRHKDSGIYDGMNEALTSAGGIYICFLNCGDIFHDRYVLENVRAQMEEGASGIYYGDVLERTSGQVAKANPRMDRFAMYRNLPCHQACFYDRRLFEKRRFNTEYRVRADYEHFLWAVLEEGEETHAMNLVVADYEGGGFSETEEGRKISAAEHRTITAQYFSPADRARFRLFLLLTLQPLREKIAHDPRTAALYARIKSRLYGAR